MLRPAQWFAMLVLFAGSLSLSAQDNAGLLPSYFLGKEVLVKIDMPATQQGIDLSYNKDVPMNWKEYSGRLKKFGVSIHKGDSARVTSVVVKKDRIEFQLDGGGYGTFFDDDGTVNASTQDKSDYEKQLERDISNTSDPDRKRDLQRELDRARDRRERQNNQARDSAQIATQIKKQEIAGKRLQAGSRFNLRWQGAIPAAQQTPEAVARLLADYVTVEGSPAATAPAPAPAQSTVADTNVPATAQLKRGMHLSEVTALFGQGRQINQSVSPEGLKSQTWQYATGDRSVEVIYVEGVVVKYSISSN